MLTLIVCADSQERLKLLRRALADSPQPYLRFFLTLSAVDGPGEVSRVLSQYFADLNPIIALTKHAPALRTLGITDIKDSAAEQAWQEPFRFRQAQYADFVVIDSALFVADAIGENSLDVPGISISIDDAHFIDSLSLTFLLTLLRLNLCNIALGLSNAEQATYFQTRLYGTTVSIPDTTALLHYINDSSSTVPYITLADYKRSSRFTDLPQLIADARHAASRSHLLSVLLESGSFYNARGFYDFSLGCIGEALRLVDATGANWALYFKLLQARFIAVCCKRDIDAAHETAQQMLESAINNNDLWAECKARYLVATVFLRLYYPSRTEEAMMQLDMVETKLPSCTKEKDYTVFSSFLHNTRAFGFFHLHDFSMAYQSCQKALTVLRSVPTTSRAVLEEGTFLYNLSQLFAAQSLWDDAIAWITKAINQEPRNPEYFAAWGNYLSSLARFSDALPYYEQARLLGVPTPELLVSIANAHLHSGSRTDTLATLREVRIRFPRSIEGFLDAAAILIEDGAYPAAEKLLASALIWHHDDARVWCNLGRIAHDNGDLQDAIDKYNKALTIDPKLKDVWINLGVLQFECGDLISARYSLKCALSLAPSDPLIVDNLKVLETATLEGHG